MAFHYKYNYPQVARDGGFKLRNYKDGPLDWRLIGSIEIERIVREQNFEQIDGVLNHLSEAPLGSILDSHILDSGIAKYFMLLQFSVQYLLFCRKFLEETVQDLRGSHSNSQTELATVKRLLSEARNEVLQLHKKLTQMEAIHEVLYPCHLCTKNFINNDSLNLHISRKHNGSLNKPEKKTEISQSICKERENDLTLINTIKLELEIKHLKNRLNNAEKIIKEKNIESMTKNDLEKSEKNPEHSIGIQSNLSEIKERDDSGQDIESISTPNWQQMSTLQAKLLEFENWKEGQSLQNSEFLNNVNSKIQEISNSLEITRKQIELQIEDEKQKTLLPSAEDLEEMLTKKVEDIGKTTAANLENIIKKIEINYKEKLQIFEKELNKLNTQSELQNNLTSHSAAIKVHNASQKSIEENYSSPNLDHKPKEIKNHPNGKHPVTETSDSETNHTFVKNGNVVDIKKNSNSDKDSSSASGIYEENCTDFSGKLPDEQISNRSLSKAESINKTTSHMKRHNNKLVKQEQHELKFVTKRYALKLTNKRLSSLGVDTKAKSLTPLLKRRYLDLKEKRLKLKENSQFYATRNKFKKFVDKLCSTKMPTNAETLLKVTEQFKPKKAIHICDEEDSSEEEVSAFSNEFILPDSEHFRQRLESILISPIRTPEDHLTEHFANKEVDNKKPIPMPRKRVVFNQPEVQNHFLSNNFKDNLKKI